MYYRKTSNQSTSTNYKPLQQNRYSILTLEKRNNTLHQIPQNTLNRFNGISIIVGYLIKKNPLRRTVVVLFKPLPVDKRVISFPIFLSSKLNVIAWLEFELAH